MSLSTIIGAAIDVSDGDDSSLDCDWRRSNGTGDSHGCSVLTYAARWLLLYGIGKASAAVFGEGNQVA